MARTLRKPPGTRRNERGFALILALFLLAMAGTLGLIIGGNGVSARKSARAASYHAAAQERAAIATWLAADALEQQQKSSNFLFSVEGQDVSVGLSLETGRIDLNGLSQADLTQAVETLGFGQTIAVQAAATLSGWRGAMRSDATRPLPYEQQALWSIDDLDVIAGLDGDVRDCLKLWGTVHARGGFSLTALDQALSLTSDIGGMGNMAVGSMIRIIARDTLSQTEFRTILLYRGGASMVQNSANRSPWLVMEWLAPTADAQCAVKSVRAHDQ